MVLFYYKVSLTLASLFLWFALVGPKAMSGSTEMVILWVLATIFLVVPGVACLVYREIKKGKVQNDPK